MAAPSKPEPIESTTGSTPFVDWGMAVVFGGAGAYVYRQIHPVVFDVNARDFNPLIVLAFVLALIGLYNAWRAVVNSLRLRRYGVSTLHPDQWLTPGMPFRAVVRTAYDLAPTGDYTVNLRCIETTHTGGNNGRYRQKIRWEHTARVAPNVSSSSGVPVNIDVPANVPPLTRWGGNEQQVGTRWAVIVRAPMPGLDYKAMFNLVGKRDDDDDD
jgi:hypothetical protein